MNHNSHNLISVLHLHNSAGTGGAFISTDRLHQALKKLGVESTVLYRYLEKYSPEKNLNGYLPFSQKRYFFEKLSSKLFKELELEDAANFSAFFLKNKDVFRRSSLLHLHNINGDFFSYLALPLLTKDKPCIWTLHDMWSFTGHCAYSYDCQRWQTGCGKCPYPDALPPIERDTTSLQWKLKKWAYSHSKLTIVCHSLWMKKQVEQSMLKDFPIYHIPNGLDLEVYQPLDVKNCRGALGIPLDKKVLIFGAETLSNPRKGSELLLKALSRLPKSLKAKTLLLTFGKTAKAISEAVEIPTQHLGYINSDWIKAIAYSAADLFLFPTRAENFGLVALESMACGTPTVSFNIGGVPESVRHLITGYLATPEDPDDFCHGIVQLLSDECLRTQLSQNGRKIAVQEYSLELHTKRYLDLYTRLITPGSPTFSGVREK
ncbi:MAG: glycosyltransferase family 4 protein [Nostoc sp.]|uniref:glycosyltransferase family 4 protein n=1 Tax=Nostoc sp. TaxID=1180 RepID=UPI002FF9EE1E